MRTYVYVDGFNLYYGALKGTKYKALFAAVLRPTLQDIYLKALAMHMPELSIVEGRFLQ